MGRERIYTKYHTLKAKGHYSCMYVRLQYLVGILDGENIIVNSVGGRCDNLLCFEVIIYKSNIF